LDGFDHGCDIGEKFRVAFALCNMNGFRSSGRSAMTEFSLVVLTNPVEGREDEYNDWYTNVHLDDVLAVPGVVTAQRYRLTETQRDPGPQPFRYLAIYGCECDDVQTVIDGLKARSGTPAMPISEAMAGERLVCFFEPITARRSRG
jgi:hypothetical protein